MSPGNWVGFDCTPPSFITRASWFTPRQGFTAGATPASVDHRATGHEGPVKTQGAVGTCTAMSLSTAIEHALRMRGITENVSTLHIWSHYRVPKMGDAGDSNLEKRIAPQQNWQYDPAQACKLMQRSFDSCGPAYGVKSNTSDSDPQIQASKKRSDSSGKYRLVGIEKLAQHDPNEFASILAQGDDLWVAFNMNTERWKSRSMKNNVIQDYSETESTGHAVVLAGYRTVGGAKQFLIHNSWGTGWGEGGYAWIGENMIRRQLRYAYRVRVATDGEAGPSVPSPAPSAQGCNGGEVRDAVTGQCTPACAGGRAPAAGFCVPGVGGTKPEPSSSPNSCAQGQAPDRVTGQCTALCPDGNAAMGGLCLPRL
jgi:hypothetical protein